MKQHFVRIDLVFPDNSVGVINIADLAEIDAATCSVTRMIEMSPDQTIVGAFEQGRSVGSVNIPQDKIPHPDTYGDFPDIKHQRLTADEFEAFWAEAQTLFPDI